MFKHNSKAEIVFAGLTALNLLPEEGNFDITEDLLYEYKRLYYLDWPNFVDSNPWNTRRYAGSSLLDLKRSRNINISDKKSEGYLYFIGNPAWTSDLKVGISSDYRKRLAGYQTYSPKRDYFIHGWEFVTSKKVAEDLILDKFQLDTDKGEWVSKAKHEDLIKHLRASTEARHISLVYQIYDRTRYSLGNSVSFKRDKYPIQIGTITKFLINDRVVVNAPRLSGKSRSLKPWTLHLSECKLVPSYSQ